MGLKPPQHGVDGFYLVIAQGFFGAQHHVLRLLDAELAPVDRAVSQLIEVQGANGNLLILNGFFGVSSPLLRGGDDQTVGKRAFLAVHMKHLAGVSDERADMLFLEGGARVVELALDRPVAPALVFGHQIDPGVVCGPCWRTIRPFAVYPDGIELAGVQGVGAQKLRHHALEQLALLELILGEAAKLLEDGVNGGGHAEAPLDDG